MQSFRSDGSPHTQGAWGSSSCVGIIATGKDSASIVPAFPHPSSCPAFAPRPLRRFITTTRALPPRRLSPPPGSPSFTHSCFRTSCRQSPDAPTPPIFHPFVIPTRSPCFDFPCGEIITPHGHGLRRSLAGSPMHLAESRSLSCGLSVPLPLLPTPSRDGCSYGRVQT